MTTVLILVLAFFIYYVSAIVLSLSRFPECLKMPQWLENIVCGACLLYVLPAIAVTFLVCVVIPNFDE